MDLPDIARNILNTLLDRYEQPSRRNVVRVRISEIEHPLYFSARDSAPRRETNTTLRQLASLKILSLHWRKWEEDNWLETVDLVPEQANHLYALLGRQPRATQEQHLRRLLEAQVPQPGWHADFLTWARAQLDMSRAISPLVLHDLSLSADLLRALAAIAALRSPVLERTLSVRLFGDSKRIEDLRSALLRVLRRHDPDAAAFGDDDRALLRAHNLDRVPEYVPLAGPLRLRVNADEGQPASQIDLTPFAPSVAISAAMARHATVDTCDARVVVTVENATSFSELLALRPADMVVVFIGGFASPTVIQLLARIQAVRPDLPFLHWGDMDAGGLRILAHLRRHLENVVPVGMDLATFTSHQRHAQPLTAADRTALATLRSHPALADCTALVARLLETNQKLEQEAIDAGDILVLVREVTD